ncbi:MAG: hypothetical protein AAF617_05650 [Bacteroidota bacterium]
MKKKNLTKLALKKTAISKLDNILGGYVAANAAAGANQEAKPTIVKSNCVECESLRVTQCKDKCPDFTKKPCGNAVAVSIGAAVANNAAGV